MYKSVCNEHFKINVFDNHNQVYLGFLKNSQGMQILLRNKFNKPLFFLGVVRMLKTLKYDLLYFKLRYSFDSDALMQ